MQLPDLMTIDNTRKYSSVDNTVTFMTVLLTCRAALVDIIL